MRRKVMRKCIVLNILAVLVLVVVACQPQTVIVKEEVTKIVKEEVTKIVTEEKVVKETVVVEKEVEKEITKVVELEKVVTATPPPPSGYNEAPMLAGLVAQGKLPPVEERLPQNPVVIEPVDEVGIFGGMMRFGFTGGHPGWGGMWYLDGWDNLVIWSLDFSGVQPNICERWEVSDDVREYTFYLRKGIRWSDGELFTADDMVFYVDDVLFNEELYPGGPVADWLPRDGADEFRIEKIDDFTVKLVFKNPYGTFLYNVATWSGRRLTWYPEHWLKQFHKDYNPNVDALVAAEEGVEDWMGLFNKMVAGPPDYWDLPERPLLYPYIIKEPLGTGTQLLCERNPYYWKVDTEGNQLPYIDQILAIKYETAESRTFAMMNGDLDVIKDPGEDNRILYFEAMDEGKPIMINDSFSDGGNTNSIHFNRTIDDPVRAEIFANKDFRIGMSYAINRQEVIDIVHNGQGTPSQVCPLAGSPLYVERLCTQYIEYDIELANEYLDKVLPEKDGEGYRLGPDGNRFSLIFTVSNDLSYGTMWVQTAELLIEYWKDVGVEVTLNSMPDSQYIERKEDNEIEMTLYTGEGGAGVNAILDPRYFVPGEYFGIYGNGWFAWYSKSAEAVQVEPPGWVKDYRLKYELEVLGSPSQEAQIAAMREVLEMAADEFWVIGISWPGLGYQPWSQRLGNIPESWVGGWIPGVLKIMYPEQWYIKE
jgi:peptide/nickel transport system substrate-binding protein